MSRVFKHAIGWGIFGVIVTAVFMLAVMMTNVVTSIYLFGGALTLAVIIIVAVALIDS